MLLRSLVLFTLILSSFGSYSQKLFETKINVSTSAKIDKRDAIIYLPAGYNKNKAYPLVIFTHGMGEAGTKVKKLYSQGLPKVLKKGYKPPFDFIMVAVQRNSFSVLPEWIGGILKDCENHWYIDKSRVYLTGLSAGGWSLYGSQLNFSPSFAKKFAAIVVNSSVTQNLNKNNFDWWKETKTPLWAIVGAADKGYVGKNAYMVNEINKRVPNLATLTVRKGVGHGGWTEVYNGKVKLNGKNMWEWLYQFKRSGTASSKPPVKETPANEDEEKADTAVVAIPLPVPVPSTLFTDTKYIKVNFYEGKNPYTGSRWNNWNIGSNENSNIRSGKLINDDGTETAITATLSHSDGVIDNLASYGGGMAPADVLRYATGAAKTRTLVISGLNKNKKYRLQFISSRRDKPGTKTVFTLSGIRRVINSNNNKTSTATFANATPDADGRFVITISGIGSYNYINGFLLAIPGDRIIK